MATLAIVNFKGSDSAVSNSAPGDASNNQVKRNRSMAPVFLVLTDFAVLLGVAALVPVVGPSPVLLAAVLAPFALGVLGLYRNRFSVSVWDDLPRLIGGGLTALAMAYLILHLVGLSAEMSFVALAMLAGLVVGRTITYQVIRLARRAGMGQQRTLILGGGQVASLLGEQMVADCSLGLNLVGYVEDEPMLPEHSLPAPVLGGSEDLSELLASNQIEQVVVAYSSKPSADLVSLIRTSSRANAEVSLVPRLFELATTESNADSIGGIPVVRLRRNPFRSKCWPLKRIMDIVLTGFGLLILSPLMLTLAVVLRISDGPGILFRQRRVGLDGREFDVLKFRSMRPETTEESETQWSIKADPRVTRLGRLMRRTSIDELPQLFNVLRGDMSLVGPRPERPHFVEIFTDANRGYSDRHRVPVGLTGWAQIHGLRGDTSISERAQYDNYYIENWTLWLDMKIIARTLSSFLKGAC